VSDQANLKRLRQARKRTRRHRRRQARQLLDNAYQAYLRELNLPQAQDRDNVLLSAPGSTNPPVDSSVSDSPSSPHPDTPPPVEPDSPHSVLTQRVRLDTPPPIPSVSPPSYSPIHSPRPSSPARFTSSVEFVEEIHIPSPRPKYYYHYDPHEPLETLITQFNQHTDPLPSGLYIIGPDQFDLSELKLIIETQDPDSIIPVFLPNSPFPYDVPVRFFYNLFPPTTVIINELSE